MKKAGKKCRLKIKFVLMFLKMKSQKRDIDENSEKT